MALVQIPLLGAELYVEVDDPNDPAVAALIAAVQEHATVTVTGVSVSFPDSPLYERWWQSVAANVRFVVRAGQSQSAPVALSVAEAAAPRAIAAADRSGSSEPNAAVMEMVSRRSDDGHILFANFGKTKALHAFLAALGVENVSMAASGLVQLEKSGHGSEHNLWTRGRAFDVTAFVVLAESNKAEKFWAECIAGDVRNVGPMKVGLMKDLAVRLRQQQVV